MSSTTSQPATGFLGPPPAVDGVKPRLIISKMRLENFKSYGGIQEIGPFHKSFTAIIGPNGSGKSNVIDAMLFVFGRRANQIRLKKLSELIHNSFNAGDINHCSVEVHFAYILDDKHDSDAYSVVEGTQFCVKRIVTRSNTSSYFINNVPCHVNQVISKLKNDCQIDLDHNRFLILQGEVEQIAAMKPKGTPGTSEVGLLEYLEDIIGSSQYKSDIEKQQQITEFLTQLRQNRLLEQENLKKHLMQSTNSVQVNIQYAEHEFKIANLHYLQSYLDFYYITRKYTEFSKLLIDGSQSLAELDLDLQKISKIKAKIESAHRDDLNKKGKYEKELDNWRENFNSIDADYMSAERSKQQVIKQLNHLDSRIEGAQQQLQQLSRSNDDNVAKLPKFDADVEKITAKLAALNETLEEKIETVSKLTEPLKQKLTDLQSSCEPVQQETDLARAEVQKLEGELQLLENKLSKGTQGKRDLVQDIESSKDAVSRLRIAYNEQKSKVENLSEERKELQEQTKATVQAHKDLQLKMNSENQKLSQYQSKIASLHQNNDLDDDYTQVQSQGQSSVNLNRLMIHQYLLQQKISYENQKFSGVYGRIADICWIDQRYECALANACGDSQNIVVLNAVSAQNALSFLREKNLGRGSFLPLDAKSLQNTKNNYLRHKNNPQAPLPETERLFDMIQFSPDLPPDVLEMVKIALFRSVGDTLVCKDVQSASRIAFQDKANPRKTVALTGEVMQPNGGMSGGKVKRGFFCSNAKDCHERMFPAVFSKHNNAKDNRKKMVEDEKNEESRRVEIEKNSQLLQQTQSILRGFQQTFDQLQQQKNHLTQQLSLIGANITATERQAREISLQLASEEEVLKTHQHTFDHASKQEDVQTNDKKLATEKRLQIQNARQVLEECEERLNKAGTERQAILQLILRQGGNELSSLKKEISTAQGDLAQIEGTRAETVRTIASFQAKVDQRGKVIAGMQEERAALQGTVEELTAKAEELLKQGEELVEARKEIEEKIHELIEKLSVLSIETDYHRQLLDEKMKQKQELESELAELSNSVEQAPKRLKEDMKSMNRALDIAKQNFKSLLDAEAPPDPFIIAKMVRKNRKSDFIERFIVEKEREKKRLEEEELEQLGTSNARRRRKKANNGNNNNDNDNDSGDDNNNDDDNEINQKEEWKVMAIAEFNLKYPHIEQNNQPLIDKHKAQHELALQSLKKRLPFFLPNWSEMSTMTRLQNVLEYQSEERYNVDNLDDVQIPTFVKFQFESKFVPLSSLDDDLQAKHSDRKKERSLMIKEIQNNVEKAQEAERVKNEFEKQQIKKRQKNEQHDDDNDGNDGNDGNGDDDDNDGNNPKRGKKNKNIKKGKKSSVKEEMNGEEDSNDDEENNNDNKLQSLASKRQPKGSKSVKKERKNSENSFYEDQDENEETVYFAVHNWDSLAHNLPVIPREVYKPTMGAINQNQSALTEAVKLMGEVNPNAVDTHHQNRLNSAALGEYLEVISEEREIEKLQLEKLKLNRTTIFMKGLHEISNQLKTLYRMLTLGGDAELELSDQNDPFLDGITFSVRPPRKSWKQIQNLSGGEKTLSSLSLVFALHYFKPTPLYVMDEIDAALDYKNVSIVANYIRERTNNNAQFIIISLRNNMFELSNRLVGIYKTNDRTKTITIDPREYIKNQILLRKQQEMLLQRKNTQNLSQNNNSQLDTQHTQHTQYTQYTHGSQHQTQSQQINSLEEED